jgi:hypothetical protein
VLIYDVRRWGKESTVVRRRFAEKSEVFNRYRQNAIPELSR